MSVWLEDHKGSLLSVSQDNLTQKKVMSNLKVWKSIILTCGLVIW